jgi:Holliday junction resolvase
MSGGSSPKRKGAAFEREAVGRGLPALRTPLSGSVKTSNKFDHDVSVTIGGVDRRIECKRRARSFATIDSMLADNFALICRDDRSRPLVVMTLDNFATLVI